MVTRVRVFCFSSIAIAVCVRYVPLLKEIRYLETLRNRFLAMILKYGNEKTFVCN